MASPYSQRIGASTDDAHYYLGTPNAISLTGSQLWTGFSGKSFNSAMRFTGVTIPAGSTILTSKITFISHGNYADQVLDMDIYGEQGVDVATFSTYNNVVGRTRTTHKVDWAATLNWTAETAYETPSLNDILQELVDDYGELNNANIAFFIQNVASSGVILPESYNHDVNQAPLLTITWSEIVGWANIASIMGVASADIASINGVAVADIAYVNGVAV